MQLLRNITNITQLTKTIRFLFQSHEINSFILFFSDNLSSRSRERSNNNGIDLQMKYRIQTNILKNSQQFYEPFISTGAL